MCPGLGEYRLGHRLLGGSIALAFLAACAWLMVGTYFAVDEIAEYVKSRDPTFNLPAQGGGEVAALLGRLMTSILAEYQVRRAAIHQRLYVPLMTLFVLYCYSLVQAYVLGVRKDRAAASELQASAHRGESA